jgi:O-6-methylguanine DNA methyltransferase
MLSYDYCHTPHGTLTLVKSDRGLCYLGLPNTTEEQITAWAGRRFRGEQLKHVPGSCHREAQELQQYFTGDRTTFTLALDHRNTPFAQQALAEVSRVSYGQTATYGDIAGRLGRPRAARAVGRAVATNPLAIVIPCHRIVGTDGRLTGYGGGLALKQSLLDMESRVA